MRWVIAVVVLGLIYVPADAAPDKKTAAAVAAVKALVRANIAAVGDEAPADEGARWKKGLAKDVVLLSDGYRLDRDPPDECGPMQCPPPEVSLFTSAQVKTLVVSANPAKKTAWFHGVLKAQVLDQGEREVHVNGVAIDDHGWKIVAMSFAHALSDKDLFAKVGKPYFNSDKPSDALGKQIAGWIDSGKLATAQTADAIVMASGTAPTEFRSNGAGATKLVKAWDALGMKAHDVQVHSWNDAIAFVVADVELPHKSPDGSVALVLGAVIVDGKWTSLNFAFASGR